MRLRRQKAASCHNPRDDRPDVGPVDADIGTLSVAYGGELPGKARRSVVGNPFGGRRDHPVDRIHVAETDATVVMGSKRKCLPIPISPESRHARVMPTFSR